MLLAFLTGQEDESTNALRRGARSGGPYPGVPPGRQIEWTNYCCSITTWMYVADNATLSLEYMGGGGEYQ